jgi:cytochrome c
MGLAHLEVCLVWKYGGRLVGLGLACSFAAGATAADLAYGEYLAGECVTCHRVGADGGIPSINSLPAPYFVEALREYKEGERDHALMRAVARSLGAAEMDALAAYFEQLGN